jgi:hypothetical protein
MSRVWGFLSALLHYVYIPQLKRQRDLWNAFIVWGSLAGCLMCLTGLGEPYLFAANGPTDRPLIGLTERELRPNPTQYRKVWLKQPERGTFDAFDHAAMMDVAREAMPKDEIHSAEWLQNYDNYYRSRLGGQPLPVLRVQYTDANNTWLYIDPNRGSVVWREEGPSRLRRWLYNGLHKFDLPVIYAYRPLWDISIIIMSLGGLALSITTIVPAVRRLRRHGHF